MITGAVKSDEARIRLKVRGHRGREQEVEAVIDSGYICMNATTEQVFEAALGLLEGDRIELVEVLLASLQPRDCPPFDESWREVIRRRSAELRSRQVTLVPWTEVKRQAREKASG